MIRFHALVTHLNTELGHKYIYQLCFRDTIKQLGFEYKGYVNKSCEIQGIPDDWQRCLSFKDEKSKIKKILQFWMRLSNFVSIFSRDKEKNEKRIFFVESLCFTDLVALALSLSLFSKSDDNFWLHLRYDFFFNRAKWFLHKPFFWIIQKKMKNRFVLLADSERIRQFYEKRLKQKVHLVPIPQPPNFQAFTKSANQFTLWWPGEPRFDKGLRDIQSLVKKTSDSRLQIKMSETGKKWLHFPSLPIVFLKPILSREEYTEQFSQCDAILLPYDPKIYYSRTSGIFVEAVFAKKMPFVKEGSWLANELLKFDLPELILDWSSSDLLFQMTDLLINETVREKFDKMHQTYLVYHSHKNYTEKLDEIFKLVTK